MRNSGNTESAKCYENNILISQQLCLLKTDNNKTIIHSTMNGCNLQVQPDGKCVFANKNQLDWEQFDVEADKNGFLYFISCHTGKLMQCSDNGHVSCANENKLSWEAWKIRPILFKEPPPSQKRNIFATIAISAGAGLLLGPLAGVACAALVPTAMSTFGLVVAGVGTLHAPLASFGAAAILQSASATLVSAGGAAASAAAAGAAGGAVSLIKNKSKHHNEKIEKSCCGC